MRGAIQICECIVTLFLKTLTVRVNRAEVCRKENMNELNLLIHTNICMCKLGTLDNVIFLALGNDAEFHEYSGHNKSLN